MTDLENHSTDKHARLKTVGSQPYRYAYLNLEILLKLNWSARTINS